MQNVQIIQFCKKLIKYMNKEIPRNFQVKSNKLKSQIYKKIDSKTFAQVQYWVNSRAKIGLKHWIGVISNMMYLMGYTHRCI